MHLEVGAELYRALPGHLEAKQRSLTNLAKCGIVDLLHWRGAEDETKGGS